jgi:hypothetical protein
LAGQEDMPVPLTQNFKPAGAMLLRQWQINDGEMEHLGLNFRKL